MLEYLYSKFDKARIASMCKELAQGNLSFQNLIKNKRNIQLLIMLQNKLFVYSDVLDRVLLSLVYGYSIKRVFMFFFSYFSF